MDKSRRISKPIYIFFAVIYFATITFTFRSDTMLPKIASMTVILFAFIVLLVCSDFDRVKKLWEFPAWLATGLIVTYALSVFVWLINIEQSMYISNGTQRLAYQLVNVLVAFCAVYLFGSKAIDYTLYSAFAMNSVFVLQGLREYGISQSINDLINAFVTGEQVGFMSITEINNITYVYGFFMMYYIFISDYSLKKRIIYISLCAFFVLMGFKRINLASLLIALILAFIFFKLPEKFKKKYLFLVCIMTAVISFVYIPFIRYGWFEELMNYFDVNTNTRIDLYNFIKSEYEFKPNFIGQGIDYVMRYLEALKTTNIHYKGGSLKYIHNDTLVKYIEMGFWGFCGWLYAMCIFGLKWMYKHCGMMAAAMYAMMTVNNFINISVGNTNHDYCVRLVIEIIIFGAISRVLVEREQESIANTLKPHKGEKDA